MSGASGPGHDRRPGRASERADRQRPVKFAGASLFIDDAASTATVYRPLEIVVSNAAAAQQIGIELVGNGSDIGFGSGPSFQADTGVQVTSVSGPVPANSLRATPSGLAVSTSAALAEGAQVGFRLGLFLVADDSTSTFLLRSSSDPGVEITASIGQALPQTVNQAPTLFSWAPV